MALATRQTSTIDPSDAAGSDANPKTWLAPQSGVEIQYALEFGTGVNVNCVWAVIDQMPQLDPDEQPETVTYPKVFD